MAFFYASMRFAVRAEGERILQAKDKYYCNHTRTKRPLAPLSFLVHSIIMFVKHALIFALLMSVVDRKHNLSLFSGF